MEKRTKSIIVIFAYLFAAIVSSNILDALFWNILSIAFLVAGVYGLVSLTKTKEFLF
jgi:hypothetical protein